MPSDLQFFRFLLDNLSGLGIAGLALYGMFRLCEKHLTQLTNHVARLQETLNLNQQEQQQFYRQITKNLERLDKKLNTRLEKNLEKHIEKNFNKMIQRKPNNPTQ